jgi:hypothetical protein
MVLFGGEGLAKDYFARVDNFGKFRISVVGGWNESYI